MLRIGNAFICSQMHPSGGFNRILYHTFATTISIAHPELRLRIALRCRQEPPFYFFLLIFSDSVAIVKTHP